MIPFMLLSSIGKRALYPLAVELAIRVYRLERYVDVGMATSTCYLLSVRILLLQGDDTLA